MKIVNLDNERLLWLVTDVVEPDHLKEILSIDWPSLPWSKSPGQEIWRRRLIDSNHPDVARVTSYITKKLDAINEQLSTDFEKCEVGWWLDEPKFKVGIHTDGELPATMQLYWMAPGTEYGTCFYHYKKGPVKHNFLSVPNSGYIMLNMPDSTGYRVLQWHGMTARVPAGTWRLSSYVRFISKPQDHHDEPGPEYNN